MKHHLGFVAWALGIVVGMSFLTAPVQGQGVSGVSSYAFVAGDDGWSTGGAPPVFPPPAFGVEFNQLTIGITEFFNFGFWQSPAEAIPDASASDLYAVRALLASGISACDVPTLRVRALAQGFAQSSLLTVNSTGDCSAAPGPAPTLYPSFFQPQGAAVADDFVVAIDFLLFDPSDAFSGQVIIDHVDILRIPVASLGVSTSERTYTFEIDEEGWASGAAPSAFDPPVFDYTGSTLSIQSLNNVGTFGFWNNQSGDFTIETGKLYRAAYDWTSISNTPLAAQNATFRTRLYTSDFQWSQTTEHRLPNIGLGTYYAWFMPPASLIGSAEDSLGVAFDLTNFNPLAPSEVTVEVGEVAVDSFAFPSGFKALPFVPTEDTTLPGGDHEFSEIIIPPGVEVTIEDDVVINVHGNVNVEGLIVGDCKRIEIYVGGNVVITGTVANSCSTTPTLGADLIIHSNGGDLILGTDTEPAEIISDGDVDITNDPTVEEWQFLVPEGGESLVPLPPVAAATASTLYDAATTTFTTEVQFSGFGADPDGGPVTFAWDFGDGGSSTEQNPLHTYTSPGKRIVTLTVTDDEGASAQATLTIVLSDDAEENIPTDPGVQLDPYFIVLEQGEEALFTAEAIDPDGQDLSYNLSLGDLTVSTDEITAHVYILPGRYELALTVTDTSGTTSLATASVYVHATLPALPQRSGPPSTEPEIRFNISTDPVKAVGPNAPIIGRRQIPPPHPKAPVGQAGKNMFLRGRGNAVIPPGSTIQAGDGGDGQNRNGQYVTAGNGRRGGSARVLVNGSLTVGGGTTISAGDGGNGGTATATAPVNSSGSARGGNGGNAGSYVWLQASRGVTFAGPGAITIDPGSGGAGGVGECFGDSGIIKCPRGDNGGRTWARGGNGGQASKTVIVKGRVAGLNFVNLIGGNGGAGGIGDADSGDGGTAAVCDPAAFGGHGGSAISYGGRGGNGRLTGAFGAIGVIAPDAFQGGDGGNSFATGGDGGDAEAESDCTLARAVGGRGGQATASGGKGGRGFNADGNGGNGHATGGDGGSATATGLQCGDDGNDALATGGDAGSAKATRGDKGGANAVDGTANANGGWGGDASAVGGPGKDKIDAPGGKGGKADAVGGQGAGASASRGNSTGGDGGDANATGGKGGNSTASPPDPCESKTGLLGGPGGAATANGGRGGAAGGFQATTLDGDGGDANAIGGLGGDAIATGGDCSGCEAKGGNAEATGGPGGASAATKGKKGGSSGSDGAATATGGKGGAATAVGGKGGDCDVCPAGKGGPGGDVTGTGSNGGNATGDGNNTGGASGDITVNGGQGGLGASCCEPKPPLPGGDGGKGGDATATPGSPGTPGGADGMIGGKAGDGGNGGDGEGPGAGGAKGTGVNVPDGSPGDPGNPCPRTVITPGHSTVPPLPVPNTTYTFSGQGSDGETYSPIGCTFLAPVNGTNQPSYQHDTENELLIFQPGNIDPLAVPAAVVYDVSELDVMTIGLEFEVHTPIETGFPGNCIQIVGFVDDTPAQQAFNLPTPEQDIIVTLPPPPVPGTSYNKIQISTYAIPTQYSSTTGVKIIDP